jgi:NTP pyrophosphatase (non-canonical NTP hydrolase)
MTSYERQGTGYDPHASGYELQGRATRPQLSEDMGEAREPKGAPNPDETYLNDLAARIFQDNAKWWCDPATGKLIPQTDAHHSQRFMLMVGEINEAHEGFRKDEMDDKLTHRKSVEVELADAIIRILDYCGGFGLDISGAIREKRAYNKTRKDHSIEERAKTNGKRF